jgi:hypothetical protein
VQGPGSEGPFEGSEEWSSAAIAENKDQGHGTVGADWNSIAAADHNKQQAKSELNPGTANLVPAGFRLGIRAINATTPSRTNTRDGDIDSDAVVCAFDICSLIGCNARGEGALTL